MLGSLVEIRTELGETVYQGALDRARLAIAYEVMVEAERVALRRARLHPDGNVVRLPTRVVRPRHAEGGHDEPH
ncbi:hypothetical protein ASF24_03520 [Methylobacterium sp. Leaf86]|nr:hypothetical protein ASF24_03520 [Methylobacterium sp. Leaf86]